MQDPCFMTLYIIYKKKKISISFLISGDTDWYNNNLKDLTIYWIYWLWETFKQNDYNLLAKLVEFVCSPLDKLKFCKYILCFSRVRHKEDSILAI